MYINACCKVNIIAKFVVRQFFILGFNFFNLYKFNNHFFIE